MDIRIERLARLLVRYSNRVKRGEVCLIRGNPIATPLIEAVYRECLDAGALVYLDISLPDIQEILLRHGSRKQIEYWPPSKIDEIKATHCRFGIWAEENTRSLSSVDPKKQQIRSRAMEPLFELVMERAAKKQLRWVGTLYPTQAVAQDAEMSLTEFTDFVCAACKCDREDPIEAWKEVKRRQQRLEKFLNKRKKIHVKAPGTDLTLSVAGRKWENCCGTENMPDGEIFTAPVENSVNGTVLFSYPACHDGREVEGVQLTFEKGKVVEAKAKKNEKYLHSMLDLDEGARVLGEFSFGLNKDIQRFTKNILFDEKIGGTIHMALGAAYPETGGKNKSALHWDMICDLRKDSEVIIDGKACVKNGKWTL